MTCLVVRPKWMTVRQGLTFLPGFSARHGFLLACPRVDPRPLVAPTAGSLFTFAHLAVLKIVLNEKPGFVRNTHR